MGACTRFRANSIIPFVLPVAIVLDLHSKERKMIKIERWYAFPAVALLALVVTGCEGLGESKTGTGNTTSLEINGDGNQVCFAEISAGEDVEIVEIDCNDLPIQEQGTSDEGSFS